MTAVPAATRPASAGLIEEFASLAPIALGGSPAYQRHRLRVAVEFVTEHGDLDEWMSRPVEDRLVELDRRSPAWQLVAFGILTGRCRADFDFLAAKNFGHSVARWTRALFPLDCERLLDAANRLGLPAFKARQLVAGNVK